MTAVEKEKQKRALSGRFPWAGPSWGTHPCYLCSVDQNCRLPIASWEHVYALEMGYEFWRVTGQISNTLTPEQGKFEGLFLLLIF